MKTKTATSSRTRTRRMTRKPGSLLNSRILVIDDEPIVIEVITAHIKEAGFWNVVSTSNSIDAVERMAQENPDLILMDISMPDVSGNYLLQVAHSKNELQHIPVIVVTADSSPETKQRAVELGACEVLTKPVDPNELVLRIKQVLRMKLEKDQTLRRVREARSAPATETYDALRTLVGRDKLQ